MPEQRPPIDPNGKSLAELLAAIDVRGGPPPVDRWNPAYCGHSGMSIARDGSWFHDGAPIERPAMVRLFATVLRREDDGQHYLVTPFEKLAIDVESTAFRAIALTSEGTRRHRRIGLTLDSGDALILGPDHPLTTRPTPRVAVRFGLQAELSRPVYYELAEIALAEAYEPPGIWSSGLFFALDS